MNTTILGRIQRTCECIPFNATLPESAVLDLLPMSHRQLLSAYSGVSAYHGYYRLLPLVGPCNLTMWNDDATWKYPLSGLLDDYLIFATTALGVQYAYLYSELLSSTNAVYEINFEDFEVEKAYDSFDLFAEKELIENSIAPYDDTVSSAYHVFGSINADELLLYNPPLLLGGKEDPLCLNKIGAVEGMQFMADLWMSFDQLDDNDRVTGISKYFDSHNRVRWRVDTSTQSP